MHADGKEDHILVNDGYDITGTVNWEWAHMNLKSAAFGSLVLLLQ